VTFPAYPDTKVALRSLEAARNTVTPSDDGDVKSPPADAGYDKHETPEKVLQWHRERRNRRT